MFVSAPPTATRTHCQVKPDDGRPSTSVMPVVEAVSVSPTRAVPVIVGMPVATSFTAVTSMVIV